MSEFATEFRNVSFTYTDSKEPALKDINLRIKEGELVLITGPSGAGKTTLCCCINGLVPYFYTGELTGNVIVNGLDTKNQTIGTLSTKVGLLFQDPASQLVSPTVVDELAFGPENLGIAKEEIGKRIEYSLDAMRLRPYVDRNPATLSGGEQQACALGALAAMRPEIYVLDEPTSNLDPIGSSTVLSAITELARAEKKTMIIVEHKIEELTDMVDTMLVMDQGRIIMSGEPRQVLKETELLEQVGLKAPPAAVVCNKLAAKFGVELGVPLTVDEGYEKINNFLNGKIVRPFSSFREKQSISNPKTETPIVEADGLWHTYPGNVEALKDVDLRVGRGDFLAIVGQNGSGKTTLVKHFNGLLRPTRGTVLIDGEDTKHQTTAQLSRKVGMVFQNPDRQLLKFKVIEEVKFGPKNLGFSEDECNARATAVLQAVGLEHVTERDPHELGKGEKQRVVLACALAMKPEVLVIDEPTTGQDYKRSREIMDLAVRLNKEGSTIIVITHDMSLVAEYAKRTILMHQGQILYDGPPREAFTKTELLKRSFLSPPQATILGMRLRNYVPYTVLTTDELVDALTRTVT
ncbi:MAG: energy-coupling factor transporter ATPase [Candidatus Bathyarchaeia archaeon]